MKYDESLNGFFLRGKFIQNSLPIRKEPYSNFELFLKYLVIHNPPVDDAFDWAMSLGNKYFAVQIAFNESINQNRKWKEFHEKMKNEPSCSAEDNTLLAIRYEIFMNSIYGFCENLSVVLSKMYPQDNLPMSFNKLRSGILSKKYFINEEFFILLKNSKWYDDVHWIRTESNHYLFGFVYFSKSGDSGYLNKPYNRRIGAPEKIDIENVENHILKIFKDFNDFVLKFGDIFIQRLNPETRISSICFHNPVTYQIGTVMKSINEIKNNLPGVCANNYSECPLKGHCNATVSK